VSRSAHELPRVVIVDDDLLIRETVRISLEHSGFAVHVVEDPSTALAFIRAEKPDLVVLDMYMGGVDGREIARRLKSDPSTAKLPVVFFTGSNEAVDVVTGFDAGAVEYIAKPIDGEVLVAKIRSILRMPALKKKG
jgi:two-component system alkaline phosphatase synthesis response regulator PhoP